MIRKRRSLLSRRSSEEGVPVSRARVSQPPARKRRIGSGEEQPLTKQQLIDMYAQIRREQGRLPVGRGSMIVMIAAVVLVALVGWWFTFGKSLGEGSQESQSLFQGLRERTQDLGQQIGSPPVLQPAAQSSFDTSSSVSGTQPLVLLLNATGTVLGGTTSTLR